MTGVYRGRTSQQTTEPTDLVKSLPNQKGSVHHLDAPHGGELSWPFMVKRYPRKRVKEHAWVSVSTFI